MIAATVPLTQPALVRRATNFMEAAAKNFHGSYTLKNCKLVNTTVGTCVYTITVPKTKVHPHEKCVGTLFVKKYPKTFKFFIVSGGCRPI